MSTVVGGYDSVWHYDPRGGHADCLQFSNEHHAVQPLIRMPLSKFTVPYSAFGHLGLPHSGNELCAGYRSCYGRNVQGRGHASELFQLTQSFLSSEERGWLLCHESMWRYIVSIDCEMVRAGPDDQLELARCTAVGPSGEVLLDMLVRPPEPISDYLTQFSGITPSMLEGVTTTLADAQTHLAILLDPRRTILVGHALENDLHVLRVTFPRIIDTSLLFPHPDYSQFKLSLRCLMQYYLGETLDRSSGHCSLEDARAALKLTLLKFVKGPQSGETWPMDAGQYYHQSMTDLRSSLELQYCAPNSPFLNLTRAGDVCWNENPHFHDHTCPVKVQTSHGDGDTPYYASSSESTGCTTDPADQCSTSQQISDSTTSSRTDLDNSPSSWTPASWPKERSYPMRDEGDARHNGRRSRGREEQGADWVREHLYGHYSWFKSTIDSDQGDNGIPSKKWSTTGNTQQDEDGLECYQQDQKDEQGERCPPSLRECNKDGGRKHSSHQYDARKSSDGVAAHSVDPRGRGSSKSGDSNTERVGDKRKADSAPRTDGERDVRASRTNASLMWASTTPSPSKATRELRWPVQESDLLSVSVRLGVRTDSLPRNSVWTHAGFAPSPHTITDVALLADKRFDVYHGGRPARRERGGARVRRQRARAEQQKSLEAPPAPKWSNTKMDYDVQQRGRRRKRGDRRQIYSETFVESMGGTTANWFVPVADKVAGRKNPYQSYEACEREPI